jgi:LemA protein
MVLGTLAITLIVIVALVVLFVFMLILYYNRFKLLENRIDNSGAQIDVQLKKRADLVPALVNVVKGYAKHEREIMETVSKARSSLIKGADLQEKVKAGDTLQAALGRLFAIAENYPQLRANENFLQLQQELSAIEDKVAYARQYYNDSIMAYENATQLFPGVLFFNLFGKSRKEYLRIPESQKNMPKVEF